MKKPTLNCQQALEIARLAQSFWDETTNHLGGFAGGYSSTHFMSLGQVAKELKVTRERIRQIEAKALKKLQHPKRSRILKPFLTKNFNLEESIKPNLKIYE